MNYVFILTKKLYFISGLACFLYFPLSIIFATKKVAPCKKMSTSGKPALENK